MKIAKPFLIFLTAIVTLEARGEDSMTGMTGPNFIENGRFDKTEEVAYPWTGVDAQGFLRKSVQERGVNIYVDKSNQFSYAPLANSASFIDLDGDGLPDIVAPDGAGFFWFWKNVGTRTEPKFNFGELMPLLVDNELSSYAPINGGGENKKLTAAQEHDKERIDDRRKKMVERLERENRSRPKGQQWTEKEIKEQVEEAFPYPWDKVEGKLGLTCCRMNGFRQLRAIAAPCDLNNDGLVDFLVGDAQGTLYFAKNTGRPSAPNFGTYTKSQDSIVLKLVASYDIVTHKTTMEPVSFMNYVTPFVCDWDNDGKPDLLVGEGTYSVNTVRLFRDFYHNKSSTNEVALMVGESRTFLSPFAWDWDGDGFLDLFVNDSEGRLTVFPNPGGKYCKSGLEMTESKEIHFDGQENNKFLAFCCPQPCDWNNDGVMDIIWSDPYGRIFYALGKEKGGTQFGPPTPVKSSAPDRLKHLLLPKSVSFCAVPIGRSLGERGGTADSQRFVSQEGGGLSNANGWPGKMNFSYGAMPNWEPEMYISKNSGSSVRIPAPGMCASWAVAPVPYEVFNVTKEVGDGPGEGNTFTLTWHNPADNAVFKQPRDAMTKFGQGVAFSFATNIPGNKNSKSSREYFDGNARVSFFIKLEGKFDRMSVFFGSHYYDVDKNAVYDGGELEFQTLSPPPAGNWFHYEGVLPKGKYPRGLAALWVRLSGRGNVSIRDVAFSTTDKPPTPK